jgi:hypothetical protein
MDSELESSLLSEWLAANWPAIRDILPSATYRGFQAKVIESGSYARLRIDMGGESTEVMVRMSDDAVRASVDRFLQEISTHNEGGSSRAFLAGLLSVYFGECVETLDVDETEIEFVRGHFWPVRADKETRSEPGR